MNQRRIVYQDWLIDKGIDPDFMGLWSPDDENRKPNQRIVDEVRRAVARLTPLEREYVERRFFQGESFPEISRAFNKRLSRIEAIHRRVVTKLKYLLAEFVKKEYGLDMPGRKNCPLCNSVFRARIDRVIKGKRKEDTWKSIIKVLEARYGIVIKSPQILAGHEKYHLL